ncbi:MAG: Co2+/Mg2+ efflux protein ApaG [Proteobacteria bacterium]|nr:Co2+/Mg2+ efflux protein ApaG [Pseudomonadota bacterium]
MNETRYDIRVSAQSTYLEEQSEPAANRYAFAYTITIANTGTVAAQLRSRHWLITDANGRVQEVHGDGVVGQQPLIEPGTAFQYTSGAVLETPIGSMSGSYQMQASDGEQFKAVIPIFRLAMPRILN